MKEDYHKWYSPTLNKDIEMLVFGHAGYPLVLFPTTSGRFYECRDFKLIESAKWFLEEGLVQIYCPDSINELSWYDKGIHPADRVKNHVWYDQFIMDEVVNPICQERGIQKVAIAGVSFGGYHAANFAFKHPERVSHMFSLSGSFDIKSFLDGYYDDTVFYNNPVDFLPGSTHSELWNMKIILGTSDWDICLEANKTLAKILTDKNIPFWFDERKWAEHDWPIWRQMFPHYLSTI
ncbi:MULTISPECIES: esterase family protein [unclassified Polaribacter]|uniref:esterase family protein n=1 Tax=unclassified Polaribacter TaxID=196858 RepID=UPI0011BE1519|nr:MULTISPECIES: alpha/beta fold hydrolase [unclassified Polaribacter]TXD52911.1 abhydrolase domain-containing 18 [Polaribacter sp. IC063]TXD60857.1 abhydrolase domain-containing 18 [Polaribacter sp. IC066]